jgi:hypothetical protein
MMQHSHTEVFVDRDVQRSATSHPVMTLRDERSLRESAAPLITTGVRSVPERAATAITGHSKPFRVDSRSFLFRRAAGF